MAVGRLKLRLDVGIALFAVIFINCVVQSQYFLEQPKHIYIVEQAGDPDSILTQQSSVEEIQAPEMGESQFMSRKGVAASSSEAKADDDDDEEEDEDEEASVEEDHRRLKGRPKPIKLPSNFDDVLRKTMQLAKRQRRPLHGDPSPIHKTGSLLRRDQGEGDDDRKSDPRLLFPLSLEISKGGVNKGIGPVHFGSYPDHHSGPPPGPLSFHEKHDSEEYDPDDDPEVQKLRLEMYKMVTRAKKWKKILKYNLAEVGAQLITKALDYMTFIY